LKARHGRVRCGHCQHVFDALETLLEAPAQPAPAAPPPAAEAVIAEGVALSGTHQPEVAPAEVPEPEIAPPEVPEAEVPEPESPEPEVALPDVVEPEAPPAEPEDEPAAAIDSAEPADEEAPPLEPELHEAAPRAVWPWVLGSVVAMVVLLVQAVIHYRTEIAILSPGSKPMLLALCVPVGCDVPLPRKADLIGIESSSLSPDAAGKLALSVTLKNRAPFAQQFPDLELTLSDTSEKPLVRRVLAPADYLAPEALAAGFGADSEVAVNLIVDAPGIPAAGYQLYLFYP
jgi:hypothetical protein